MSPNDMLYYNVRVNEMGPDPRRVKNCSRILKKHDTDNVITNMTLLIYLKKRKKREEGGREGEEGQGRERREEREGGRKDRGRRRRGRERGKREGESQN